MRRLILEVVMKNIENWTAKKTSRKYGRARDRDRHTCIVAPSSPSDPAPSIRRFTSAMMRRCRPSTSAVSAFTYVYSNFFSNSWLIVGKLWEARSPLYRNRFLQVDTKYSFESSWRDLQDLHLFTLMRLWEKRTEIENEVMKMYTD